MKNVDNKKCLCVSGAVVSMLAFSSMTVADESHSQPVKDSFTSYPMAYMTLPESDTKTVNLALLIEPTYRNSKDNSAGKLENDFSFDRLRFGFYGSLDKKIDYFLVTELAPNAITNKSGSGAKAFIGMLTFKDIDLLGGANVAVGSMAIPMGYSFYAPSQLSPWISYADVEYNLYGCGSINCFAEADMPRNFFTNIWKPGVMVFDQIHLSKDSSVTYTAGLFNTTGTLFTDNAVESKDFNGSVEYHNKNVKLMYGTRIGASKDVAAWSDPRDRTRHALTFMYNDYRSAPWWIWAEYMRGTDEQAVGVSDVTADGYFIGAGYKFAPKWEAVVRHSEFNRNVDVSGQSRTMDSVGVSYKMDNGVKVMAEQTFVDDKNINYTGIIYPDDTFFFRVSMPFNAKIL